MDALIWFLMGYLIGSFPTGYVISRLKGIDITKLGSGNIGGANVYRVLGGKYALLTALGDVLKGFLPVIFAPNIITALAAAFGALTGAIFSLYLKFRGGKGFATLFGIWLALILLTNHWEILFIGIVAWIVTLVLSRYTSLANLVTVSVLTPVVAMTLDPFLLSFAVFSLIIIFYSHRENVSRLLAGKERSFLEKVKGDERW